MQTQIFCLKRAQKQNKTEIFFNSSKMSKNRQKFCYFCLKTEEEVTLIDTKTNLIQIENECFEFSAIYKDLLNFDVSKFNYFFLIKILII